MPKVYAKKARKDYPAQGISRGDVYYEWAFYRQKPQKSLTPPTRAQLTQSEWRAGVYEVYDAERDWGSITPDEVREAAEQLQEAADAADEARENMPENLQDSEQGQMLEQACADIEQASADLEALADEMEDEDFDEDVQDRFHSTEPDLP
jgi:hypothetical protein